MVRKCLAICFAILLICSLAACGSQGESQSTPPPSGTVAPVEVPTNGGSIGIVMPQDPGNWNPLRPQTREMVDLYGLIYDGLVRFDEEVRPIPGLPRIGPPRMKAPPGNSSCGAMSSFMMAPPLPPPMW